MTGNQKFMVIRIV